MIDWRKICKMRHEDGYCICMGVSCTEVDYDVCDGLNFAYDYGYLRGQFHSVMKQDNRVEIEAVKKDICGATGLECCGCNPGGCSNRREAEEDNI